MISGEMQYINYTVFKRYKKEFYNEIILSIKSLVNDEEYESSYNIETLLNIFDIIVGRLVHDSGITFSISYFNERSEDMFSVRLNSPKNNFFMNLDFYFNKNKYIISLNKLVFNKNSTNKAKNELKEYSNILFDSIEEILREVYDMYKTNELSISTYIPGELNVNPLDNNYNLNKNIYSEDFNDEDDDY